VYLVNTHLLSGNTIPSEMFIDQARSSPLRQTELFSESHVASLSRECVQGVAHLRPHQIRSKEMHQTSQDDAWCIFTGVGV
jgi:hypothetical protein